MRVQFFKKMFNGEMRDFARIPVTDTKDILETPVRATDVQRFPKEWAEFKKNENKKSLVLYLITYQAFQRIRKLNLNLKVFRRLSSWIRQKVQSCKAWVMSMFHSKKSHNFMSKPTARAAPKKHKKRKTNKK